MLDSKGVKYFVSSLRIKQVNMAAAARYKAPPLDRSKPGEMWVNSDNIRERPKCDMLPLLIHQGEPGHHLQVPGKLFLSFFLSQYTPDNA